MTEERGKDDQALHEARATLIAETEKCQELENTVRELECRVRSQEKQLNSIANCMEAADSVG